jgi:hypothetical protein
MDINVQISGNRTAVDVKQICGGMPRLRCYCLAGVLA